jgi:hypothetical protein
VYIYIVYLQYMIYVYIYIRVHRKKYATLTHTQIHIYIYTKDRITCGLKTRREKTMMISAATPVNEADTIPIGATPVTN